jgi:hypothetical protein
MNFFTNRDTAARWCAAHPDVSGMTLSIQQALQLGVDIFGRLLDDNYAVTPDSESRS